jgi:UDP-4-amino-4,6-dideoxy-N-acetyl-beta-L-altrosamine transaminase
MSRFLPYGRQLIEDDDVEAVVAALRSDFLTTGPRVEAFEAALAARTGAAHAVVCNSGTAALHLAAMAIGLKAGDQVIVPAATFLATANAPHFTGAEIVFADVDPDTGLLTPELLEAALARAPRARACFPVHLNGHVCDIEGLKAVADRRRMVLVDDACHAIGARHPDGAPVGDGKRTPLTAFSFHPVKSIAMGEGGAVTTDDPELARRCRLLRSHGMERDHARFSPEMAALATDPEGRANGWVYEMDQPGYNYRAPDVLCALGLSQLKKLDRFLGRRRELAALYDRLLAPLAPAVRPVPHPDGGRSGWHLYAVLIDFERLGRSRAAVIENLAQAGVGTQVHYLPVHLQPYYRRQNPDLELPGALAYYARCLSLPFYPAMSDADVEQVAASLVRALGLA